MLENLQNYRIILASGSPRRRELLSMLDIGFEVDCSQNVDENYPADLPAEKVSGYLATLKADAYRRVLQGNYLCITADTTVISDGQVLGKPVDHDDAFRMLRSLAGHAHKVITGVEVFTARRRELIEAVTEVWFARLSDSEIWDYIRRCDPLDKAGAYGIQESIGAMAVERIDGSFYNVMGLPVHQLYRTLLTF